MSRLAQLGERGSTSCRCHEVSVSTTTHTAWHDDDFLAVTHQVGNGLACFLRLFVVLAHDRANWHLEHQVLTTGTMHLRALAMCAALCFEMMLETIIDQRRQTGISLDDDVSAVPAVTTVGPAFGHVGFSAERHATGTAVAALHEYVYFVYEHVDPILNETCPS